MPFLVVLALVGAAIALALVGGGKESTGSPSKDSGVEAALPTITNETPTTTSSTETTTLQDCDPGQPLGDTQPAIVDDPSLDSSTDGEQIPSLSPDGSDSAEPTDDFASSDIPSIEPTGADSTVTVDQDGNVCDEQGGSTDGAAPPIDSPTDVADTSGTDTNTTGATGDWPSGKEGWTVIVAGYPTEERATQRSVDVQEDGFEDSGVLFSTDFLSLCPGIHVVFSGVFDTEAQAKARIDKLSAKPDYAGMYVREIKTSGSRPSGCTQVQSQN